MSSEGADTRKDEENLTLVESLIFRQLGNEYRNFIRDSPIADPLGRMSEFIKLKFGLSSEAEYARFKAELHKELYRPESSQTAQNDAEDLNLPSNGGQDPEIKIEMLTEDEIKIEICPEPIEYGNEVVETQHKPIDIKREVISIEDGPEVAGSLPKGGLLSCGQCRTRSGDFLTMVELEEHIKKKHGGGQSHVTQPNKKINAIDKWIARGSSSLKESHNNKHQPSKRPRLATPLSPPKNGNEGGGGVNGEITSLDLGTSGKLKPEVKKASNGSLRISQAPVTPSEPCPQTQGAFLDGPSSESHCLNSAETLGSEKTVAPGVNDLEEHESDAQIDIQWHPVNLALTFYQGPP